LYEREGELVRVDALLAAARAGRGGVLLITGRAGIGKTMLLGAARERAGQAGMQVLAGRGGELESGFSFGVARQLFEPLLAGTGAAERDALLAGAARRALVALEGQAGAAPSAAGSEPPFAVMHGLYWLAVNASGAGPVLVAVDDVHWADQASLRFLLYLADRLAGLPVALVLSWRAAEAEDDADRLARLEQIAAGSVVSLAPLSRRGVRALLTHEFGTAPAERFAAACHAVTGGNAFLLRELIQQLRADGIGPSEEAAARVAALGPRSVAQAVALRVARLGPAAGELAPDFARTASGAMLREVRGRLALASSDLSTARAELQAAAGTYEALHLLNPSASCWRSALALAVAVEDPAEARRLAGSELQDARRAGLPRPAGIALRTRGLLEGGERGLRDLREAAELLAASGARLEHARALVELGAALRRANQRSAAREPLRTGLDLAYRCGATPLAQRARAELLAAGARPRRGALTGLEALTASERRVAEL
jgi:hypothetical protein